MIELPKFLNLQKIWSERLVEKLNRGSLIGGEFSFCRGVMRQGGIVAGEIALGDSGGEEFCPEGSLYRGSLF